MRKQSEGDNANNIELGRVSRLQPQRPPLYPNFVYSNNFNEVIPPLEPSVQQVAQPTLSNNERLARKLSRNSTRGSRRDKKESVKIADSNKCCNNCWGNFAKFITCWAPSIFLSLLGRMKEPKVQQAWREKVTLCFLIILWSAFVLFMIFGLRFTICPPSDVHNNRIPKDLVDNPANGYSTALGGVYSSNEIEKFFGVSNTSGKDLTSVFPNSSQISACSTIQQSPFLRTCEFKGTCLGRETLPGIPKISIVSFDWDIIDHNSNLIVYNGNVWDMSEYFQSNNKFLGESVDKVLRNRAGRDITQSLLQFDPEQKFAYCLNEVFLVGYLSRESYGCFASNIIMVVSMAIVFGVILIRFVMAVTFDWFLSSQLDKISKSRLEKIAKQQQNRKPGAKLNKKEGKTLSKYDDHLNNNSLQSIKFNSEMRSMSTESFTKSPLSSSMSRSQLISLDDLKPEDDLYTILLVTCYSEGEASLRTTLESLANTDYHDQRKLLFIVADGIVTGSGESKSTPQILLDMITIDEEFANPEPVSYVAIASGKKRHNMAKVFVGDFWHRGRCVPVVLVVKCGTPDECTTAKPGNRGKRDSQLILMNYLQRVNFNDKMSPLDYELFNKIYHIIGVTSDIFEIVLMVDADTRVASDSLHRMVSAMKRDPHVMGLCGETKIANKRQSWVTGIQVFEYYISHHLGKAFESMFGGVTCLPGCFCMYRIKARKNGNWVPILANPEIIQEYSQTNVDTLHKKNLLLLGEDRFLTTMMLKTFPKRKMIFVPRAICKTVVPDEFRVLLSQRRRWINSTIHNLLELVLIRDLCGIFCFSMQFVIFLELVGTVVLPAALVATGVLIGFSVADPSSSLAPLLLLGLVLLLPAVLILITTFKLVYIMWMFLYLLALPVWNFILPLYAFWHFDDFSWGQTRKVTGEKVSTRGHDDDEDTNATQNISFKTWSEWTEYLMSQ